MMRQRRVWVDLVELLWLLVKMMGIGPWTGEGDMPGGLPVYVNMYNLDPK